MLPTSIKETAMAAGNSSSSMTMSQKLALGIGALFVLIGVLGFFATGFAQFARPDTDMFLFGFEVNPLHNIVHLAVGGLGLLLYRSDADARKYGWILAIGYGLTFVYGLIVAGTNSAANFLALNTADNLLHLVSALAGVAVATLPARAGNSRRAHHA